MVGQCRWWVLVVSDLSPPRGPQVGSFGEARQHMAVVIQGANVPSTNVSASPIPAFPRAGLSGGTPRTAAPGISCRALSVSRRVSRKVAGQQTGPIVAIARRRAAANRR